jgi:arginine/ornithine N-succinyltransferase beta subunit
MTDGYIIELFDGASTIDCKIEDLKPISLTEDILVKLGFEKTENPREMKYEDYSVLFLREIRFVICNYMENPPTVKVQFLHQLQNLYHSLTGEEITFKN